MAFADSIRLPGEIGNALVALEARDIARRAGRPAGRLRHIADRALARGENLLTKWWLARMIGRGVSLADRDEARAWLDDLRNRAAAGSWSVLPERGSLAMVKRPAPARRTREPATAESGTADAAIDRPVLFYVAGGGFILPPTPRQAEIAEALASGFGARAVLGRHRLAPEYPYPQPVDDLAGHYLSLIAEGVPATRIVVGGDSAGAALLLAMLLRLRDDGEPMPAGVLLFSPWTDLALRGWSYVTKGISSDSPFRMETAAFAARLYLGDVLPTDPAASPAYAELEGLPPIAVHCSRYDMHFDDALRLAEQAEAAGVPVRVNYWESPRHHLERFRSTDARESIRLAATAARDWLSEATRAS